MNKFLRLAKTMVAFNRLASCNCFGVRQCAWWYVPFVGNSDALCFVALGDAVWLLLQDG